VRLLVVDDDIAVRMTLSMALDGVTVLEGWRASGTVALAIAERADAVILDRRLPDDDGLRTVRALRQDPETADLPIVVVTANDHPAERALAFSAGADEHAVKPLDPVKLLALVQRIIDTPVEQRRLRRTVHRARMHVGREDGGWDDLLTAGADGRDRHDHRSGKRRRWLARASS
jgi:CheY-like chemotaxis protein